MFYNILDQDKQNILPHLKEFKKDFYLAGGTALALQLGHRQSIDFDFFSSSEFKTDKLFIRLKKIFKNHKLIKIQEEEGTLIILANQVKLSFFFYPYKLIDKILTEDNIRLASVIDIACMKLSAIISRATPKDYIDLFFILQDISLTELLIKTKQKMPELDENLILKSLVYFKDLEKTENIRFKRGKTVSLKEIQKFLEKQIKEYLKL